jgi:hypothetical protein
MGKGLAGRATGLQTAGQCAVRDGELQNAVNRWKTWLSRRLVQTAKAKTMVMYPEHRLTYGMITLPCHRARSQIDLSKEYWMNVFEPAIDAWQAGETPNPDVGCNRCVGGRQMATNSPGTRPDRGIMPVHREIKFGALMDRVLSLSNDYLATGRSPSGDF